ncbi:hypothetical protein [Rheinheimera sp. F8]|uniref:hypothetical protein n=1 Tax=Rheinheimera sp. F8 TaxID=1763998 RepID=UPI000744D2B7|nr:hypothetical protein [Rheinheimera sp. F8]ALZ74730.1 hypothetical protein ATY27_02470 [Rheinheimera sp. F8]
MQTLISAIFFLAALALLLATVLAPCYLLSKSLQHMYPRYFRWPAWRWTLVCLLLALGYSGWRQSFADIWMLTQSLLIGSLGSALLLLPLSGLWQWWRQRRPD